MGDGIAHAKLSASGAHRWMNCPASVRMEEDHPRLGSKFAAEGTAAHALGETCLREHRDADYYIDHIFEDHTVDLEMAENVQEYLDYVRSFDGELIVEQRVDFSPWVPGGFGTADAIVLKDDVVHVIDLKYGKGIRVHAEDNPQGKLYALGVLHEFLAIYEVEEFVITIVQPRMDHVSEWRITKEALLAWGVEVVGAAAEALDRHSKFNPGAKQCQFCGAKPVCPALAEHNMSLALEGFETVTEHGELKELAGLSRTEIAHILHNVDGLKNWANAVEAHAQGLLERGEPLDGFKLVEGRSLRQWSDEAAAEKALVRKLTKKGAYTQKLISPAQAEKKLGKDSPILKNHVTKPPGKPTIAVESDKRPALTINVTEGFEVEEIDIPELETEAA